MPTDYILFVHGVKTRDRDGFQQAATTLFDGIKKSISDPTRELKPIFFFWGDQGIPAQNRLEQGFERSRQWPQFWFRDFRTKQILEFVGDGALYLSRHVGSNIVREFHKQVLKEGLKDANPAEGDRLHFVTHSWGTVILFDILFATRWEDDRLDKDNSTKEIRALVQEIRNALFGLPPVPERGIPLAGIHTMGSPLVLFTLLTVTGESTNDLSTQLNAFVKNLYDQRNGKPLPWRNFAHPGDPLAYPLQGVMPQLLRQTDSDKYIQIEDLVNGKGNPMNLGNLLPFTRQWLLPILSGDDAHGSYWKNETVARTIGSVIQQSMRQ